MTGSFCWISSSCQHAFRDQRACLPSVMWFLTRQAEHSVKALSFWWELVFNYQGKYVKRKRKSLSRVQLSVTPWTIACQTSLSMEFSIQNTGVGSHPLLQGIFPTQRSNLGLPPYRWVLHCLSHQGSLRCCSGQPVPPSADLPDPGVDRGSPALQADSLPTELPGKPPWYVKYKQFLEIVKLTFELNVSLSIIGS